MRISDWSSDVCSSDLIDQCAGFDGERRARVDLDAGLYGARGFQRDLSGLAAGDNGIVERCSAVDVGRKDQPHLLISAGRTRRLTERFQRTIGQIEQIDLLEIGRAAGREKVWT